MKVNAFYRSWITLALFLCMGVAACQQRSPDGDGVPVTITGVDHLADHLSVQQFSVNHGPSNRAGGGSGEVCCMTLPSHWRPDLTVKVQWNVTNWRDCKGEEHEAMVPVEKYDEVGFLFVHFLANGKVRVVSSNYGPEGANTPGSPYPVKDPIPDKHPWDIWDLMNKCKRFDQESKEGTTT